ncbi:MAG: hypothetical protein KKB30_10825 [Proteobacteria bacterium]|nr:hypothetical protein [Pseudomonadota bacterium]MBU1714524.1 hypothetical protein [Pseudomonadota bacterium]
MGGKKLTLETKRCAELIKGALLDNIRIKFSYEDTQSYKLWISLTSIERSEDDALVLLDKLQSLNFPDLQEEIFRINLSNLLESNKNNKPWVGVWWEYLVFGSQLTLFAKRFCSHDSYNYLGIISESCLNKGTRSSVKDFLFGNYLLIPNEEYKSLLNFLNAVFIGESLHVRTYFPKGVIRIGQPHGLDIPLDHACITYGGGRIFDYILTPIKERKKSQRHYRGIFPRALIEHNSINICAIPAGYAKLDEFFQVSRDKKIKDKIVYHISLWGVEHDTVRNNIGETLQCLLVNFPDHETLFRPDPTDHDNEKLLKQISQLNNYSNFRVSTSSSYIEDYADAKLLITHREKTGHLFAYATGRPILLYHKKDKSNLRNITRTGLGYVVYNKDQLIHKVEELLHKPKAEEQRIRKTMQKTIHNPGSAVDYVLSNMDIILHRKKLSSWESYPLYALDDDFSEKAVENGLEHLLRRRIVGLNIAQAAVDHDPSNPLFRLYEAEFLSRISSPIQETFYFTRWYRAIVHIEAALQLSKNRPPEIKEKIEDWILNKGLLMANAIKWYIHNNINKSEDYPDIDRLISIFSIIDKGGRYYSLQYDLFKLIDLNISIKQIRSVLSVYYIIIKIRDKIERGWRKIWF